MGKGGSLFVVCSQEQSKVARAQYIAVLIMVGKNLKNQYVRSKMPLARKKRITIIRTIEAIAIIK